jgi:hypothetical protein
MSSLPGLKKSFQFCLFVHNDSYHRLWQRGYVPFGVFAEKKRIGKLNDMHNNPVKRRLVSSPDPWLWSSFRFYSLNDSSALSIDGLAGPALNRRTALCDSRPHGG